MANTAASKTPTAKRQTLTKWEELSKISMVPITVKSVGYKPVHSFDGSTHTRIPIDPQVMIDNISNGGGFELIFKPSAKPWTGWKELQDKGIECVDFRCKVCRAKLPLDPIHIREHFKVHLNQNRNREAGGTFLMTISKNRPFDGTIDGAQESVNYGEGLPELVGG